MDSSGIVPDGFTYSILFDGHSRCGNLDGAMELLEGISREHGSCLFGGRGNGSKRRESISDYLKLIVERVLQNAEGQEDLAEMVNKLVADVTTHEEALGNAAESFGEMKDEMKILREQMADLVAMNRSLTDTVTAPQAEVKEHQKNRTLQRQVSVGGGGGDDRLPRVDVQKPTKYNGNRDSRAIDNFLFQVEYYLDLQGIVGDDLQVKTTAMLLEGSLRDYVRAYQRLMLDLPDMLEQDKLNWFILRLQLWAQSEVEMSNPETLEDASVVAERLADTQRKSYTITFKPAKKPGHGGKKEDRWKQYSSLSWSSKTSFQPFGGSFWFQTPNESSLLALQLQLQHRALSPSWKSGTGLLPFVSFMEKHRAFVISVAQAQSLPKYEVDKRYYEDAAFCDMGQHIQPASMLLASGKLCTTRWWRCSHEHMQAWASGRPGMGRAWAENFGSRAEVFNSSQRSPLPARLLFPLFRFRFAFLFLFLESSIVHQHSTRLQLQGFEPSREAERIASQRARDAETGNSESWRDGRPFATAHQSRHSQFKAC
ncbi:hypothetical protein EJ110_NYTH10052 [Nymphaea thermarum]|nr:hypothetical protein EJ110_NYTH10052 [Nymphaea thermarum]